MESVYSAVRTGALNKAVLQHKLIGFYNPYEKCLQRGTDIEQSAIRLYRVNIAKLKSADKKVFQKN